MSADINSLVLEKICITAKFALHMCILWTETPPKKTSGDEIFQVTSEYLEEVNSMLLWPQLPRDCAIKHGSLLLDVWQQARFFAFFHSLLKPDYSTNLEDLENYIDDYYDSLCIMGRSQKTKKPRTPDSPASTGSASPPTTPTSPCSSEVFDMFTTIDNKLTGLDARVALIEVHHKEFQQLWHSLEYSQHQIDTLTQENKSLQHTITSMSTQLSSVMSQLSSVVAENKNMKETILDLQARSMRDNLIFTGIPEPSTDKPENAVKDFLIKQLKLSTDTVNNITSHRVNRLGQKHSNSTRPGPIIVKFEHFK